MISQNRGNVLKAFGMVLPFVLAAGQTMASETTGPTISGYVDTQYNYDFNQPLTGITTLRSYDAQDNNIANTAHLSLAGSFGEGIGYVVDLDAGRDAKTTTGETLTGSAIALQEAYLTYLCPVTKLGLKVGKFATFEGIEVIETNANPTITRGYLYGLAEPFTHVGGVVTYAIGKIDFAAGMVNGWDLPNDNNDGKTFVGKMGLNLGDPLSATLSGTHGPEQASNNGANRDSIDLTVLTKLIPKVDLYLQGNTGTEAMAVDNDGDGTADDRGSWSGAGIQPVIHFTDKFSLGGRVEYFYDKDGARTGVAKNASTNMTITPGYKLTDNILARAEYRYDTSNKKIWVDDKGVAKDSTSTMAVQFVVSF